MDHLQFINKMIIFVQLEGFFFFDLTCSQNKKGSIFIENKHPFFPCLQTGVVSSHTQRNALVTLNWKLCVRVYVCIYIPKRMDLCVGEGISRTGHPCCSWHTAETDISALALAEPHLGSAPHCRAAENIVTCPRDKPSLLPLQPGWAVHWLLLLHPQLPLGPRQSSSDQEQALGTCISCLLNLRYEKGRGRARGGHALDSKASRFSHGGTAPIHLWLCHPAPSLLTLQMNIL